jgi:hypothetical protein
MLNLSFSQCKTIINDLDRTDLESFLKAFNDQPEWLEAMGGIDDLYEVSAVIQGGCTSGAFMPAVTYHTALEVMSEHGNNMLDYIEDHLGEVPAPKKGESWAGMACFYCSLAVELWCSQFENITDLLEI